MSGNGDIQIIFDGLSCDCYAVWQLPLAMGYGTTKVEALDELREAAHFCIDVLIDKKLKEIKKEA